MKDCQGIFGKLFGHKFEGRYSIEEKKEPFECTHFKVTASSYKALMDANTSRNTTYEYDICVRCGEKMEKK